MDCDRIHHIPTTSNKELCSENRFVWNWYFITRLFHVRCADNPFLTCNTSEVPILLSYCLFMPIKYQLRHFVSSSGTFGYLQTILIPAGVLGVPYSSCSSISAATMGVLKQTSCLYFYDQCLLYSSKSVRWSSAAAKTFCVLKLMSPPACVSLTVGNSAKRLVVDMLFSTVPLLNRSFMSTQPPLQRACRAESWAGRVEDKAEFLTHSWGSELFYCRHGYRPHMPPVPALWKEWCSV